MLYYLTTKRSINRAITYSNYTIDDYLAYIYDGIELPTNDVPQNNVTHSEQFFRTVTRVIDSENIQKFAQANIHQRERLDYMAMNFEIIKDYISMYERRHGLDVTDAYEYFKIPKKSGGLREICAPKPHLKEVMSYIKLRLDATGILSHDCAYAYVKGRSCKDVLIEHQYNNSKWFLKIDLKDFFGSCNKAFIKQQLKKLFLLHEINDESLDALINIATLNDGLPQGTPLSPIITNLIMVPIDYAINKALQAEGNFVYTRYADDLLISSKYNFNKAKVLRIIRQVFQDNQAPFTINDTKTRYGSSAGSNWNLGLMLNKDNNITIGHKKVQQLKSMINNFLRDFTNGTRWSIIDTQEMIGRVAHAYNINKEYTDFIIKRLETKYNISFKHAYKSILNNTAE